MAVFLIAFLCLAGFAGINTLYDQHQTLVKENHALKSEIVDVKAHVKQQKLKEASRQKLMLSIDGFKIKNLEQETHD